MEKTAINTSVKDFNDVQRALEAVKTELDLVKDKLNPVSEDEEDASGIPGEIRIVKNTGEESLLEIKTKDGWKKPMIGESRIILKNLTSNTRMPEKKSIDELEIEDSNTDSEIAKKTIYDEKADEFSVKHLTAAQTGGLPRPDYDSGWTEDASGEGSPVELAHNLDTVEFSMIDIQISNASTGANATWVSAITDDFTGGYVVQVKDSNTIYVGILDDGAPDFNCSGITWEGNSSHFRLRLWK